MNGYIDGVSSENSMAILKAARPTPLLRKKDNECQDNEDDTQIGPPPRPFVKWVGGKRQLLSILHAAAPDNFGRYYEPFIGGGAFLFSQLPDSATISDANPELINCYQVIHNDVEALIRSLRTHKNEEEHFYAVRAKKLSKMTAVQRASRFIFLNKTCFNGLYRENKSGQFNSPFGRYEKPKIVDTENLRAISEYLNTYDVEIKHSGYQFVLDEAQPGDYVYFDPPYAPMTKTANFASYVKGGLWLLASAGTRRCTRRQRSAHKWVASINKKESNRAGLPALLPFPCPSRPQKSFDRRKQNLQLFAYKLIMLACTRSSITSTKTRTTFTSAGSTLSGTGQQRLR